MNLEPNTPVTDEALHYVFCLYVAGLTARSQRAIEKITEICDTYLAGRYELEIVDIYQQPALAKAAQIFAVPTLVRTLPSPLRRFIGDISKKQGILVAIGMRQQEHEQEQEQGWKPLEN